MLDRFGNAVGGYRTPYLDVPIATYHTSSKGETFCPELARTEPFDWERLTALYRSPKAYRARLDAEVARAVRERRITPGDGMRMRAETAVPARRGSPGFD